MSPMVGGYKVGGDGLKYDVAKKAKKAPKARKAKKATKGHKAKKRK